MRLYYLIPLCMILVGCREVPDDYVTCGIMASCPETHKEVFVGWQCVRCYIPSNMTISPFNMTKICEDYILSGYEEECLEYKVDTINYTCSKFHWDIDRDCDEEFIRYCREEANFICCETTCSYPNTTNICAEYHLVRKSK